VVVDFLHHILPLGTTSLTEEDLESAFSSIGARVKYHDLGFISHDDYYTTPRTTRRPVLHGAPYYTAPRTTRRPVLHGAPVLLHPPADAGTPCRRGDAPPFECDRLMKLMMREGRAYRLARRELAAEEIGDVGEGFASPPASEVKSPEPIGSVN